MALVGDAIMAARETIPDQPQTLPVPTAAAAVVSATGSTLPAGTYAVIVTQRNAFGETGPATEITGLIVGANQGIQITSALQPSAVAIRAYLTLPGGAAGSEQQFIEGASSPFTISTPLPSAGVPPLLNKAWLPDTDGPLIAATPMFRWINDGLKMISKYCGGLLDYAGVGSVINQPLYTLPGTWFSINSIWYDGFLLLGGDRGGFYRRNSVTSAILLSASISVADNRNVIEVWPQPARTGLQTTLSAPMAATDTVANLTSVSGVVTPFGFIQVDTEIMSYSKLVGNQAIGLIRGLGGSAAVAHANSAPVIELNIVINGKRDMNPTYVPGQSLSTLPVPVGWEVLLFEYVAGRAKLIEHDSQSLAQFHKEMADNIKEWARTTKGTVKRRQVGPPSRPAVYGDTPAGGLIIN